MGEAENLQAGETLEGAERNRGEIVVVEIERLKEREIGEGRDWAGERVALERERSELREGVEIGRKDAGEGLGG